MIWNVCFDTSFLTGFLDASFDEIDCDRATDSPHFG
jgi:hypothetical protein